MNTPLAIAILLTGIGAAIFAKSTDPKPVLFVLTQNEELTTIEFSSLTKCSEAATTFTAIFDRWDSASVAFCGVR